MTGLGKRATASGDILCVCENWIMSDVYNPVQVPVAERGADGTDQWVDTCDYFKQRTEASC